MALSDVKNKSELDILFADNDEGLITPANVRTLMASIQPKRGDMVKAPTNPLPITTTPVKLKFDASAQSSMDLFVIHPTGGQIVISGAGTYFFNFTLTGKWAGNKDLIVGIYLNGVLYGVTVGKAGEGVNDPCSIVISQYHVEIEESDLQAMIDIRLSGNLDFNLELDSAALEIEYEVFSIKH